MNAAASIIAGSNPNRPVISVVATIFNSELTVKNFVGRCRRALTLTAGSKFEIILVDDKSTDGSLGAALAELQQNSEIVVIELARNYGQHLALLAGLRFATGEFVVCMDGDGDEDPAWIADFINAQKSTGADIVIGSSEPRRKSLTYRTARTLFLRILGSPNLSSRNETTARLMTSQVAEALTQYSESSFYFGGIVQQLGFQRVYVAVSKADFHPTRYGRVRLVQQALAAITSFSVRPLRLLALWGLLVSGVAFIGFTTVLALALLGTVSTSLGWVSIMLTIIFFGGNSLLALGLIGEYVSTVLSETKRRPQYHIRKVHRVEL